MNAVTPIRPTLPAPSAGRPASRANAVEALLRRIDDVHLEPFRQAAFVSDLRKAWRDPKRHGGWQRLWEELPPRRYPGVFEAAQIRVGVLDEEQLGALMDTLSAAIGDAPDPKDIRPILALLVDAFPNARPHSPEGYFETLAHDAVAEGYTASVVAEACRLIRREHRFPPTISELLEACAKAENVLKAALSTVERGLKLLWNARAILAEPREPDPATMPTVRPTHEEWSDLAQDLARGASQPSAAIRSERGPDDGIPF